MGLADAAEALGEWSGHSSLNEASVIVPQTGLSETRGLHGARLTEKPKKLHSESTGNNITPGLSLQTTPLVPLVNTYNTFLHDRAKT